MPPLAIIDAIKITTTTPTVSRRPAMRSLAKVKSWSASPIRMIAGRAAPGVIRRVRAPGVRHPTAGDRS
jgi:hypothetical protein